MTSVPDSVATNCSGTTNWQRYYYYKVLDGKTDTCDSLPANKTTVRFAFARDRRLSSVIVTGKNLTCHVLQVTVQPPEGCSGHCADTWCIAQQQHEQTGLDVCTYGCKAPYVARSVDITYVQSVEICEVTLV